MFTGTNFSARVLPKAAVVLALVAAAFTVAPASNANTGGPGDQGNSAAAHAGVIPGQYIVTLKPGENPRSVAAVAGASPKFVYEHALNGFAARLSNGQLNALQHNRAVEAIEPDQEIPTDGYLTQATDTYGQPWGLDRIDQRSGLSRTFTWWSSGT